MKTHKSTAKRFRKTGSGKVMRTEGHHGHLRRRKSKRAINDMKKMHEVNSRELKKKINETGELVKSSAMMLSEKRAAAAVELQKRIEENLRELGMKSARFVVDLNRKKNNPLLLAI